MIEAELVLTPKLSAKLLRRRYNVSVYHEQSVLVPNDTRLLDSRTLPGKANAEFGLNVTQAVRMWSSSLARTYTLLVGLCSQSIPGFLVEHYWPSFIMCHTDVANSSISCFLSMFVFCFHFKFFLPNGFVKQY